MGFLDKLLGAKPSAESSVADQATKRLNKAQRELAAIAEQDGRVGHPLGQQILTRELTGLQENLTAAVEALGQATSGRGGSIGVQDVGAGLARMCQATLHDPKWVLQKNVGTDRCRRRVAGVLRSVEKVAEQLRLDVHDTGPVAPSVGPGTPLRENMLSSIRSGDAAAVRQYLERGGAPSNPVEDDSLPLHEAIRYGQAEVAALLIDRGADVNGRDKWGCSPLHYAVVSQGPGGRCLPDVAELLLNQGADVNARSKDGWSPLMSALDNGQQEMATLLRQHGAEG